MKVSHRLVIITAVFVTCLITANIIVIKPISLGISLFGQPLSLSGASSSRYGAPRGGWEGIDSQV